MAGRDVEKLSPKALEIFKKLQPHYPLGAFGRPQWLPEGKIEDNGVFDLRTAAGRKKLEGQLLTVIGYVIRNSAHVYKRQKGVGLCIAGFEEERIGRGVRDFVEVLLILGELDFQIETLDPVSGY